MANKNRKLLYLDPEVSYGTPVALSQAIPCIVRDYNPWVVNMRERQHVQNHFGSQAHETLDNFMSITVEIDLAGSGTAGDSPLWATLAEICGRAITANVGVDVIADLDDSVVKSATLGLHVDNFLFKMAGVRGSLTWEYTAGQPPVLVAELWGIPQTITNQAVPAIPDLSGFIQPVSINNANTTFTVWGYAAILNSLTVNDGYEIVRRDKPNDKGVYLRNRMSRGSLEFELPDIASKDFWALIKQDNKDTMSIAVGTVAGNIATQDFARVQLINPRPTENDETLHVSADAIFLPTAGSKDDESTLTLT